VIAAEGIVDVHVVLSTGDLGMPRGTLDAPVQPLPGPAQGELAGTFASAYRRSCDGTPAPGEVCAPGGVYWMGSLLDFAPAERLVVMSPFFVDSTEVTVAAFRNAGFDAGPHMDGSTDQRFCTFTATPGAFDDYPVTCATTQAMGDYCAKRGAAVLSEAQFEYLASGRRSTPYVWGVDPPRCEYAVYDRHSSNPSDPTLGLCRWLGEGPQKPGAGTLDRVDLPGGTVLDLVGNAMEFVRDTWSDEGGPCWNAPLLYDPVCAQGAPGNPAMRRVLRGGDFAEPLGPVTSRKHDDPVTAMSVSPQIGFRCAR
jgi:formylglycine-generating enzyme required for sulfatase activity